MNWTNNKYLQPQKSKIFLHGSPKKLLKKKKKPEILQSSWALHSLHAVLENSIVHSNPILWHSINCWDFVSATHFIFAQLYALFPVFLTIPTWFLHILSKLDFLLLSLLFLFLYNSNKKGQTFSTIINEKKKSKEEQKRRNPCIPESKQERRIFFSGCWEFWFLESRGSGKDLCLE